MVTTQDSSFPSTDWSEIARLDSPEFPAVLERLCHRYWFPVFAFFRRRRSDVHEAEDLTQSFFARLLSSHGFRHADPTKGRFRSFLLTAARNFDLNDRDYIGADKRGGSQRRWSIDCAEAELLFLRHQPSNSQPEDDFDRAWVMTLMEAAVDRLRQEYIDRGHLDRFELFLPCLRAEGLDYERVAEQLESKDNTVRQAASRFRKRYGQLLREEIRSTLTDGAELEDEIAWMTRVLARH